MTEPFYRTQRFSAANTLITARSSTSGNCSPIQTNSAIEHSNPPLSLPEIHIVTPEPLTREALIRCLSSLTTSDSLAQEPVADQTFSEASTLYEVGSIGREPDSLYTQVEAQDNSCLADSTAKDQTSALLEYLRTSATIYEEKFRGVLDLQSSQSGLLKVDTITSSYDNLCYCTCHIKHRIVFPRFLKSILGQSSVEQFASVPRLHCVGPGCKKDQEDMYIVKYIFPGWFSSQNLFFPKSNKIGLVLGIVLLVFAFIIDVKIRRPCAQSGDVEYLKTLAKSDQGSI